MNHLRYLWYVLKHKWYVLVASWKYGCLWRGLIHDLSKFYPDEWFPYVEFFEGPKLARRKEWDSGDCWTYPLPPGTRCYEDVERDFNMAWLLHQHRNPHHHQFWVILKDDGRLVPLEMPEIYVREMVADWTGTGLAIHGKDETVEWYLKNKDKMKLHPATEALVQRLLGIWKG